MSESVERILTNWSIDGTGPLTRSVADASTSGWIENNAPQWSIESFLPIEVQTLLAYLTRRAEAKNELDEQQIKELNRATGIITDSINKRTAVFRAQFSDAYHALDPDSDCRIPPLDDSDETEVTDDSKIPADENGKSRAVETSEPDHTLMKLCDSILTEAAYKKLTQDDIESCVGVASQWGVPLSVDFELFEQLAVYARGDIIGRRCKRRWTNLYRMEMVEVAIYQRLVVLFKLSKDHEQGETITADQFHLRIFKNIPKLDVDMLLPGTKVRLSKLDRAKVIVPSLSGWLFSLQKISRFVLVTLALAAYYSTALVIGLFLAGIGYMVKSFFSYFQTKNRYMLDLTRNLYFQKLDTNAGAAFQIIQQSGRQSTGEAILAFYALLSESEPLSTRRLRRKCERLIREAVDVEIDFRVDRAVEFLTRHELIETTTDAKLRIAKAE